MTRSTDIFALRFGTGLPGGPFTPEQALADLTGPDQALAAHPMPPLADFVALVGQSTALRKTEKKTGRNMKAEIDAVNGQIDALSQSGQRLTIARALDSGQGFRERLVAFFADHFTTVGLGRSGLYLPYAQVDEAIRPHLGHRFADMLVAVTLHPSMLIYLDQSSSIGPTSRIGSRRGRGLNENLARELLELHTLGVDGAYGQDDVRQLAELLTGLKVTPDLQQVFDARLAEPGAETVLGRAYDGADMAPILMALEDLATHPATARHLAQKLCRHFLADTPEPDAVAAVEAAFTRSGGDLPATMEALLTHPAAFSETPGKVRQPFELVTAGARALGVTGADVVAMKSGHFKRNFITPMIRMGQRPKTPPGPDGWPEDAEAWLTPPRLAARIDWAMNIPAQIARNLPDPQALAQASLGARGEALGQLAARAETLREGVGIVLASPEFNRR